MSEMDLDRALYIIENMSAATSHGQLSYEYNGATGRTVILRDGERDARIRWNGRDGMSEQQLAEFARQVEVEHNRVSTRGFGKSLRRAFGRKTARA